MNLPSAKKTKLQVAQFKESLTQAEIEKIGRDFVYANLCPKDATSKELLPCCKTKDGKWVFFKSTYMKLLGKQVDGIRQCEGSRVRRLHWIIPVVEEETEQTVLKGDFDGARLAKMGHKAIVGSLYRIYWVPIKSYVVFLVHYKGRRGTNTFNLVSAYRVSEPSTRIMLETLFPV